MLPKVKRTQKFQQKEGMKRLVMRMKIVQIVPTMMKERQILGCSRITTLYPPKSTSVREALQFLQRFKKKKE